VDLAREDKIQIDGLEPRQRRAKDANTVRLRPGDPIP